MHTNHSPLTIDCYVRADLMGPPVDALIDTLRDYEDRDVIDALTVRRWPGKGVLTTDTTENLSLSRYRRFQTWADRAGVSLEPGFTVRERGSLVDDQPTTVLVFPMLCLAIHADGELTTVVPHQTDTTTYTVEDALADLVAHDRGLRANRPVRTQRPSP